MKPIAGAGEAASSDGPGDLRLRGRSGPAPTVEAMTPPTDPPTRRAILLRRRWITAGVATIVLIGGGTAIAVAVGGQPSQSAPAAADTAAGLSPDDGDDTSEGSLDTSSLSAGVAAQLEYAYAHWDDTENDEFGMLDENDCVNFTSQTLLARGWETDDEWWYDEDGDPYASSDAWISSTALMYYLEEHPERATALTDDERDQVKVGDIVQFDWDDSGDRDHTAIVTAVITEADGIHHHRVRRPHGCHVGPLGGLGDHRGPPGRRGVLLEHPRVVAARHPAPACSSAATSDDLVAQRPRRSGRARRHAELRSDVRDVPVHGVRREQQPGGDLSVGLAAARRDAAPPARGR